MKLVFVLLVLSSEAHAGFAGFCRTLFSRVVVMDQYQFEEAPTSWLVTQYQALGARGSWGRLDERDGMLMNIMGAELRWRLGPVMKQFETPEGIEAIGVALELYSEFEGNAVVTKDGAR